MKISANHESKISNEMLEIPQWQPDRFFKKVLKEYGSFTSIITGARMSGKSNMVKFLLTSHFGGCLRDKFDMIVIFSKTILNGHYQNFLSTKLLFEKYDPAVIETLKKIHFERKKRGLDFKFLVIFDDMATHMKWDESITDFFYNSRHYKGSIFFLTQKYSEASTNWRNNTMLTIILQGARRKEKLYAAKEAIVDGIEPLLPDDYPEAKMEKIASLLQTKLLVEYNAIIITPFCKRKIKQFRAPLAKTPKKQLIKNEIFVDKNIESLKNNE